MLNLPDFITISGWPLLATIGLSAVATAYLSLLVLRRARALRLFDPVGGRRVHAQPTPRIGGIALWAIILLGLLILGGLTPKVIGLSLGLTIIFGIGLLDDIVGVDPRLKFTGQVCAASCLVLFGITISSLTHPLGGSILLPPMIDILLTIGWVGLLVNAFNFIDGIDGLASSVAGVASLTMLGLSLLSMVNQPETAGLAAVVLGASLGFLVLNWHPAKLFMGDSGSHTLGFMIAAIAIISGGKLATAALVLAIPLVDLLWAVVRRLAEGRSPFAADRKHLHHRLLDSGISQPRIVLFLVGLSALLGLLAIVSNTTGKILVIGTLAIIGLVIGYLALRNSRQ